LSIGSGATYTLDRRTPTQQCNSATASQAKLPHVRGSVKNLGIQTPRARVAPRTPLLPLTWVPSRLIPRESLDEVTVDHGTTDLGEQMDTVRRPAHLLTLANALVQHLIDRRSAGAMARPRVMSTGSSSSSAKCMQPLTSLSCVESVVRSLNRKIRCTPAIGLCRTALNQNLGGSPAPRTPGCRLSS